ncbi:restriction endonuclease [Lysinibacillus sphaericus]|uniref:restriction endonuclease n=1 Tax=Lysinibacillus sphaericus TaxID=1421 RepID=UPI003F7A9683
MWIILGFLISIISMAVFFIFVQNVYFAMIGALVVFFIVNSIVYYVQLLKDRKIRAASIAKIHQMSGIEFEEYLQAVLKKLGYTVQLTETTGDFGADLILQKGRTRTVVQAKRYKGSVGIKAVQEILGAKSYYDAQEAWVVTNSYYTKAAKALALKSNVRLLDKNSLVKLALDAGIQQKTLYPNTQVSQKDNSVYDFEEFAKKKGDQIGHEQEPFKQCPVCSSEMIIRQGKHGGFYGCSNFPICRGTLPLKKHISSKKR